MNTFTRVPISGRAFVRLMLKVDAKLSSEGHDIPARPLLAGREIGMRDKIAIPLAGDPERMPPELKRYAPLNAAIHKWYHDTYGDRLKIDMFPGRTVVQIDRDLYTLRIPRVYGSVQFVTSRDFLPDGGISNRGPIICNLVQLLIRPLLRLLRPFIRWRTLNTG